MCGGWGWSRWTEDEADGLRMKQSSIKRWDFAWDVNLGVNIKSTENRSSIWKYVYLATLKNWSNCSQCVWLQWHIQNTGFRRLINQRYAQTSLSNHFTASTYPPAILFSLPASHVTARHEGTFMKYFSPLLKCSKGNLKTQNHTQPQGVHLLKIKSEWESLLQFIMAVVCGCGFNQLS